MGWRIHFSSFSTFQRSRFSLVFFVAWRNSFASVFHPCTPTLPSSPRLHTRVLQKCFSSSFAIHNVSHLPSRSWCSVCFFGRGLSLGSCRIDTKMKEADQITTVSVDTGFFGQPQDRAHNTLPVLIVRDRKRKGTWSHPVPSKGVTHSYPAKDPMTDLDVMGCKRVLESDQEPSIVALCDAVRSGWHNEIVPLRAALAAPPSSENKL